jgi:iron complex transport system substrate-binding protein
MEAGFNVVLVSDFMETTPLGRAEWIKFMALFFNREAAAEEHFADVAARYEEMAALVHGIEEKPTVLMGFENRGTWYLPGGQNYMARYVADAGGNYLWADDDSSGRIPLDFEAVYEQGGNADYWLNLSQFWTSLDDVLAGDERYANFAPFTAGTIYNHNARLNEGGGNDFNESGHANPDVILADLIKIFHPNLLPDHELIYYRHLK